MKTIPASARLRMYCRTALLTALLCILSVLSFPIGTVPVTLGLLGVFLCGLLLPPRYALSAPLCYLALGALGLPVFAGMQGGIGVLLSVTGGFLFSYPIAAWLCATAVAFVQKRGLQASMRGWAIVLLTSLFALPITYTVGCAWYVFVTDTAFIAALSVCVLPFLPFDVCKVLLALSIVTHAKPRFRR